MTISRRFRWSSCQSVSSNDSIIESSSISYPQVDCKFEHTITPSPKAIIVQCFAQMLSTIGSKTVDEQEGRLREWSTSSSRFELNCLSDCLSKALFGKANDVQEAIEKLDRPSMWESQQSGLAFSRLSNIRISI